MQLHVLAIYLITIQKHVILNLWAGLDIMITTVLSYIKKEVMLGKIMVQIKHA